MTLRPKHLVYFVVEKIIPLIGGGALPVTHDFSAGSWANRQATTLPLLKYHAVKNALKGGK